MSYRPMEIAQRLGISSSTLRLWSNQFAPLLSGQARKESAADGASVAQRRYTDGDLELLTLAKDLLAQGLTYEETRRRLKTAIPQEAAAIAVTAPAGQHASLPQELDLSLREALEAKDRSITALKESLAFMDVYLRTVLQEREDARTRERLLQQQLDRLQPHSEAGEQDPARPWWKRLLALP